jgi:type I restriction enzyme S subunit
MAYVSEKTYQEYMTRGIPKENDVLFTTEGPLGEVALVPPNFKFSLAQRIIVLRPKNSRVIPKFLKWILQNKKIRSRYIGLSTGSTLEGIASKWFKKLYLVYPSNLKEQSRISSILDNIQDDLNMQQELMDKYLELKKGLMQKLLTGKIRVKV